MKTHDYQQGDLVKYLPTGEPFTVHEVFPGNQYRPAHIGLNRVSVNPGRVHVVDVYTDPENVKLITRAGERTMFPGDGWSQ